MNKYQTSLESELFKSSPKEVQDNVLEYISTVKFIQNLIAPEEERGYAKDRPKDTEFYNDGRIQVDVTNPHILEDVDFFRERAIFFRENGKYTNLSPNPNPKGEYAQFWKEELRRWRDGLVRPSDGEWIPGYLYYYWNYSTIWLTENKEGSKKANRVASFPDPWLGDYLFFHYLEQCRNHGKHAKNLKTRGIGMSFKNSAMSPRNMFVYPGSGNPNFHLASEKTFLQGDRGIFGKILDNLDWIGAHTPLPRVRLIDSKRDMEVQLGFQNEYGNREGLLSSVQCISLKDNPDKARGVRGVFCHYEEDGLFPNIEKAWNVNRPAFENGGVAFGLMLAAGTGGTEGASFEGSEKLFYNAEAYNIYAIPNVFDKNTDGSTTCGHFWGVYMNRNECYDKETGEPDVIKALIEVELDRYIVKYNSSDPNAITQKKAELPVTPQEAVMRTSGTLFPVADLKEYLEEISVKKESFLAEHYVGDIIRKSSGILEFKPNLERLPLRSYDKPGDDLHGNIEIFEQPRRDSAGNVMANRYIAGIDPVDADAGTSLTSCLVLDTFTDRIVAEYTGRPRRAVESYEIILKLLNYYNAVANYESNLKGIFSYFDQKRSLHRLCDVPQILKDMELVKDTNLYGNKAKGTRANKMINQWGRQLQADWLNSVALSNQEGDNRLNLHRLRSIALIEEYIKWNEDGNFDRVSAGIMLFILREEKYRSIQSAKNRMEKNIKTVADDPFFTKNYDNKIKGNDYNPLV